MQNQEYIFTGHRRIDIPNVKKRAEPKILLKEDGSLDIERIKTLPLKEYIGQISHLTKEQHKEYVSKMGTIYLLTINEKTHPIRVRFYSQLVSP